MKDQDSMQNINDEADNDLRRLFKVAGPRAAPPEDMRNRVYEKTFAYWQDQVEAVETIEPKSVTWKLTAIAASICVLGLAGMLTFNQTQEAVTPSAGEITFATGGYHIRGEEVGIGQIANGALISTSVSGQLEIRLAEAVSLRMDKSTSATIHNNKEVWLHDGRIYIDSQGSSHSVRVITPQASIVDIGTQFEIVVNGKELTVAVREGGVDINLLDDKIIPMSATQGVGEVVAFFGVNVVSRKEILSTDPYWSWTHTARLPFSAGKPKTHQFLSWATREIGLELSYKTPIVKQISQKELLTIDKPVVKPSVQLIRQYLETTTLAIVDLQDNQLVIDLIR